jgi:16S rRNA processing protein RimM
MAKKQFLEIGEVVSTHGVVGEMRVQPWCDSPDVLTGLKTLYGDPEGKESLKVRCRPHKRIALVKVQGVDTVQDANLWRGRVLYASRRDLPLPKGRYFICDLIGLAVKDAATGEQYGEIVNVTNAGASDIYHMMMNGKEILIPAIPDIVVAVDVDGGEMLIRPMEGLFE